MPGDVATSSPTVRILMVADALGRCAAGDAQEHTIFGESSPSAFSRIQVSTA
ncbi:MAG: hypothetical protein AAFN27_10495 [Pseudomonadota bacterium]